ncbi:hypothetical protein V2W45_1467671 [Cenococcum geophilum]
MYLMASTEGINKLETYVVANRDSLIANNTDNIDNLLIREEGNYKKGNIGGELSFILRKRKLKRDNVTNYNSNNPTKESSRGSEGGEAEPTLPYSIKPPYNKASSYTYNKEDSNSDSEINNILGERITKLGREYRVYKSGLLNSKNTLKSY